jgi:hypothetical protein
LPPRRLTAPCFNKEVAEQNVRAAQEYPSNKSLNALWAEQGDATLRGVVSPSFRLFYFCFVKVLSFLFFKNSLHLLIAGEVRVVNLF